MSRRRAAREPSTPDAAVQAILEADRICWFPVRHFSAACARHVEEVIDALQPDCVLVEGPDDATPLIPALVAEDTEAPVSILSTWLDKKNVYGLAGTLSVSEDVPVRFRAWWPFTDYSPELAALRAGAKCGAELAFIDCPLPTTVAFEHARQGQVSTVTRDRRLKEGAYYEALRKRGRRRNFDEFWAATFEVRGLGSDTLDFLKSVLTFAWCTRNVAQHGLDEDGTLVREAHMRWQVNQARKRHEGWIVVVTGAFHSVALPWTKPKRAKRADRYTQTLLCAHSYPALARLYGHNRAPGHGHAVWQARHHARPHADAAEALLVEVMRAARDEGLAVSTADAIGAVKVAENLSRLRDSGEPTLYDLRDASQMAFEKGGNTAALLEPIVQRVLVGSAVGTVSASAGQVPLLGAFYEGARAHRIDVTGVHKTVRCDLGKHVKHRRKSAFLHQANRMGLPMFDSADKRGGPHFRGPDPVRGIDLHLITETWGVRWREGVDALLVELADRGSTLPDVAGSLLGDELTAATSDAARAGEALLSCAQMMLTGLFDRALDTLEGALAVDARFLGLASAVSTLQQLHGLRTGIALDGVERVLDVLAASWTTAVLRIPSLTATPPDAVPETVEALQDVVRLAVAFEARDLDEAMLAENLVFLTGEKTPPMLRGAAFGVLYSLGRRTDEDLATALDALVRGAGAEQTGPFLEGLFVAGKAAMLGGDRLLMAVDTVFRSLEWEDFRALLPDLRRAFTQFIPSEIDAIGAQIAARIGVGQAEDVVLPAGLRAVVLEADRAATDALGAWRGSHSG